MVDRLKHPQRPSKRRSAGPTSDAQLDAVFHALSDRTRRAMLRQLAEVELSVREIAPAHDMSMQAVSKHLQVLEKTGLVVKTKAGRLRRCRIEFAPLQAAAALICEYTDFWQGQLDSLEAFLGKRKRDERK